MGMYTELVLGMEIMPEEKVIQKLKFMLDELKGKNKDVYIDHPLFTDETDWKYMLISGSYYFDGQADSELFYDNNLFEHYFLNIRCNFKNYNKEIDLFLDWLAPYIMTDGFLGYKRYEEYEDPTLIYKDETTGKIFYKQVKEINNGISK